jgi:hypothetical protein
VCDPFRVVMGLWVVDVFRGRCPRLSHQRPFRPRWSLDICEPKGRAPFQGASRSTSRTSQGRYSIYCAPGTAESNKFAPRNARVGNPEI